jgi:hypothetical protein
MPSLDMQYSGNIQDFMRVTRRMAPRKVGKFYQIGQIIPDNRNSTKIMYSKMNGNMLGDLDFFELIKVEYI